jgi:hypothetical protein
MWFGNLRRCVIDSHPPKKNKAYTNHFQQKTAGCVLHWLEYRVTIFNLLHIINNELFALKTTISVALSLPAFVHTLCR